MLTNKVKAEADQAFAFLLEYYPAVWRKMYLRLVHEGFTEAQAFDLVKTYINTSCRKIAQ